MATNQYFKTKVRSEQQLFEDLVIESLQMFGQDVYYLPREIVNKDKLFLDDVPSRFSDKIEARTPVSSWVSVEAFFIRLPKRRVRTPTRGKAIIEIVASCQS